jgi:hypothetical protein
MLRRTVEAIGFIKATAIFSRQLPRNFLVQNFADGERDGENHIIVLMQSSVTNFSGWDNFLARRGR